MYRGFYLRVGLRLLIEHIPVHLIGVQRLRGMAHHTQCQAGMGAVTGHQFPQRDMSGLGQGKAVDAGAQRGKVHTAAAVVQCQLQCAAVAGGQKRGLAALAAAPDRWRRVDDPAAGESKAGGDPGLTGGAAVQLPAGIGQFLAGNAVNSGVHPTAAQQ